MLECTLCKLHSAWVFGSKLMCYAISRCSLVVLCYTNLTLVCTIPAHDEEHFLSQLPSAKGTTASTWCFTWQYSVISHHVCNCSLFQYFSIFFVTYPKRWGIRGRNVKSTARTPILQTPYLWYLHFWCIDEQCWDSWVRDTCGQMSEMARELSVMFCLQGEGNEVSSTI